MLQKVWKLYKKCCEARSAAELGIKPVVYRTFCYYWQKLVPHIVIGKPRSDLCWTCQQNSDSIMKMINKSDHEKAEVTRFQLINSN